MLKRYKSKPVEKRPKKSWAVPTAHGDQSEAGEYREVLKALNDTSQSARTSWIFLISFMAYLYVAIASVTHTDLLLNTPIKLPILQIEIALASFFFVAPLLFILIHFGVLLHHAMVTQKAGAANRLLGRNEGDRRTHPLRQEVSSYFFTQRMAGPDFGPLVGILLRCMTFITLIVLPLILLLFFQIKYLPMHDAYTTWFHRGFILLDILVLVVIGLAARASLQNSASLLVSSLRSINWVSGALVCFLTLFFSLCVATLPSGSDPWLDMDAAMSRVSPTRVPYSTKKQACASDQSNRCAFWVTAYLFERPIDFVSGRRPWFSRNLVITNSDSLSPQRDEKEEQPRLRLRGRDLRYATFDRSLVRSVDFTASVLVGASFKDADLRGSVFGCEEDGTRTSVVAIYEDGTKQVRSQGNKVCAILHGADLSRAKLSKQTLQQARIEGVILRKTDLRGFNFSRAKLPGADLSGTDMRGANFDYANLQGAILYDTRAEGASFIGVLMDAANLNRAHFDAANLRQARLLGANMTDASLYGADFKGALLFGANFARARIWWTGSSDVKAYTLSNLSSAKVEQPKAGELARLKDVSDIIDGLGGGFTRDRLRSILSSERPVWENSAEARSWQASISEVRSPDIGMNIVNYLGDLVCWEISSFGSKNLLHGFLSNQFKYPEYYYEDFTIVDLPPPPGLTQEDIERIRDEGGFGSAYLSLDEEQYFAQPEMVAIFHKRIMEPGCLKDSGEAARASELLQETIRRAKAAKEPVPSPAPQTDQ